MPAPKVYIVILNYSQWQDSRDCLESVLQSAYTNFSIFLVDNNSGNNSIENLTAWLDNITGSGIPLFEKPVDYLVIKRPEMSNSPDLARFPKITFIQNEINAGFAAGNNIVLQFLKDQDAYIWLLNPDMTIKNDTLGELVRFTVQQPINTISGVVVRYSKGNHKLLFYGGGKINFRLATVRMVQRPGVISRLDYISGSCLFTHAGNFKLLGLLPEDYFLYWEETEWCYRAKQRGYGLAVCQTAICYDKISSVIGKSFMANYYYVRNGLLFVSKFRKKKIPVVLFFVMLRFLKRIVTGQWKRARGVCKGTIDFLKMKPNEAK